MDRIKRKEILDDPNWIKFSPMSVGVKLYLDVLKEHDKHLCLPKKYGKDKDVFMIECWTCRQLFFFHNNDDFNELRKITSKEHWLYNDFPEEFQHLIVKDYGSTHG